MNDAMDQWVSLLVLFGIMLPFIFFTGFFYRRWFTKNYYFLFLTSLITGIWAIVLCVLSFFYADSLLLRVVYVTFFGLLFLIMHEVLFYYFMKDKIPVRFIAEALVIIGGVIFAVNVLAGGLIILVSLITVMALSNRRFPKRKFLLCAYALFIIGHLLMMLDFFVGPAFLNGRTFEVSQIFQIAAFFVLQLIFYHRIVDRLEAVSYSAVTDGLTGCYTKHYFTRKVNEAIRDGSAFALIFSDIDFFKRLNDTQGHQVGDEILKLVARTMREIFDDVGIVGRYGGEEFAVLITDPLVDPGALAEAFRTRVEQESPSIYPVTVSVGYTMFESGLSAHQFIGQADEAMYKAKQRGKNRVVSYQVYS